MTDEPTSHDFLYVHTDIPAGTTIREWQAQRAADRAAVRHTARAGRRRAALRRVTADAVRIWLRAPRQRHRAPAHEVRA
jgi:urocanate hydratase